MKKLQDLLNEASEASKQAHALGLDYGGLGQWLDPKTRKMVAKTVNGKLVKTSSQEPEQSSDSTKASDEKELKKKEKEEKDLGKLTIFNFDNRIVNIRKKGKHNGFVDTYDRLLKAALHTGGETILFVLRGNNKDLFDLRGSEKETAKYLKNVGITSGIKIKPFTNSTYMKKKDFVENKINEGYTMIKYFDADEEAVAAVNSLKASYNKLNVHIETFTLPKFPTTSGIKDDEV